MKNDSTKLRFYNLKCIICSHLRMKLMKYESVRKICIKLKRLFSGIVTRRNEDDTCSPSAEHEHDFCFGENCEQLGHPFFGYCFHVQTFCKVLCIHSREMHSTNSLTSISHHQNMELIIDFCTSFLIKVIRKSNVTSTHLATLPIFSSVSRGAWSNVLSTLEILFHPFFGNDWTCTIQTNSNYKLIVQCP